MVKKITFILICLIFAFSSFNSVNAKESPPKVSADGVILMDGKTGEIIYSKNPDKPYPPASTTKIMTALLTLEKTNLDDIVTIGKNPPNADGSKIYLFKDEKIKVKDLLYSLLLASANDSAEALAEHVSGSKENFAKEMNKRAKELGAKNTNFENPSGLYGNNHRTTARDLSLILKELIKHPEFQKIAKTLSYKIPKTNKSKEARPLWNENRLMQKYSKYYYKDIIGGKTGYTTESKHSYVAAANRDNQTLITVLLHDKKKTFFPDAIKLLDYGYKNYELKPLYKKGDYITTYNSDKLEVPLYAEKDFYYLKDKSSNSKPNYTINNKDLKNVSFKKGDNILTASIVYNNKNIGTLNLISGKDHELIKVFNLYINKRYLTKKYVIPIASAISAITLLLIVLIIKKKKN
ncbi:serine hydrolase [Clostridium oceanicum]